jgi:hypothetical protein
MEIGDDTPSLESILRLEPLIAQYMIISKDNPDYHISPSCEKRKTYFLKQGKR